MMIPLWLTYTTISGTSSVAFNFINRHVLKDGHDSTSYAWWFEFFRFLFFFIFTLPSLFLLFDLKNLGLFSLIGISEFFSVYFYMKMHSKTELSVSSVISQLRLVLVPLLAFFLLSEKLNFQSYLGILVILAGQLIVSVNKKVSEGLSTSIDSGIKYSLISVIFVSLNVVLAKPASQIFPVQLVVVAMAFPSLFLFPLLMKNGTERILKLGKMEGKKIFLASVFNAATNIFMILALRYSHVSRVTALFQSIMMLQVLLGILFLNERKYIYKKLAGSIVVIAGVLLLI